MRGAAGIVAVAGLIIVAGTLAWTQEPVAPLAHFHHVHLNSTDPKAAIDFYTAKFLAEKAKFAGVADAVLAADRWLLFTKVNTAPKAEVTSAIWHIGWGAENMQETYQKQVASGTTFQTEITDISDQGDGKGGNGRFFFAYVDGPDHALIELNTAANHSFGHLHLLSSDPIAASEWYVKEFGLTRRGGAPSRELRFRKGRQTAPAVSLMMDNVNVIIYPVGNAKAAFPEAWKGREELESTKDHTIDHVGFRVENLDAALARLRADGVRVTEEPKSILGGKVKYAFIEGPDRIRIEVIEDRTAKD